MDPKQVTAYMDAVTKGFETVAMKLKTPVSYLWELAVRQSYVVAGIDIFWMILSLICFIVTYKVLVYGYGYDKGEDGYRNRFYVHEEVAVLAWVLGITSVFALVAFTTCGTELISRLVNPQYAAIQDVIKMFKD